MQTDFVASQVASWAFVAVPAAAQVRRDLPRAVYGMHGHFAVGQISGATTLDSER